MPRRRSTPASSAPSLVASSALFTGKGRSSGAFAYQYNKEWQKECYRHYHICGEARFAATFFGHAVSRAVLFAQDRDGNPLTEGESADVLAAMFAGINGQKQILNAVGLHLTVAGECYLVGRTINDQETWEVASVLEMKTKGDTWYIDYGNNVTVDLTEADPVIRIWTPNPSGGQEADSPFRTLLPILREIEWVTRHVFAQIQSRLAGAGLLFMPQGVTFPPPPGQNGKAAPANDADAFMQTLGDAMMKPIEDPSDPSALVPPVVMIPGDQIDSVKLMHFWSELDAESKELRSEAIRRFALGMDLPPEQILGMSSNGGTGGGTSNGVSHWGAWQIEEATIKMHIEPKLDVIVQALTISYLRNVVEGTTDSVGYSTEKLRLRPDRSKEAFELWDRGVLSTRTLLLENGFTEADLPSTEEFKTWLLVKIASGSATPEQVQAALTELGVPLAVPELQAPTRESRPTPSLDEHPTKPRTPAESALLAACDALVYRALERAGNRIRAKGVSPRGARAYEVHTVVQVNGDAAALMEDAWSCGPQVLAGIGDPKKILPALNAYCLGLLTTGTAHSKQRLAEWMETA